jgi:hypothetical protein
VWLKTSHNYPSIEALRDLKRPLTEVLLGSGYIGEPDLATAQGSLAGGGDLAEHLLALGLLTEDELLEIFSLQHGIAGARVEVPTVSRELARSLPRRLSRQFRILPVALVGANCTSPLPKCPPRPAAVRFSAASASTSTWCSLRRATFSNYAMSFCSPSPFRGEPEKIWPIACTWFSAMLSLKSCLCAVVWRDEHRQARTA